VVILTVGLAVAAEDVCHFRPPMLHQPVFRSIAVEPASVQGQQDREVDPTDWWWRIP
jgi:hypothetical protein